jgi:biopolymer transport protein ExbB
VRTFLGAAAAELKLSPGFADNEGIKERIASRLERICGRVLRGAGVLATIGVVGLFGTVWGIINSFIGTPRRTPQTSRWSRRV